MENSKYNRAFTTRKLLEYTKKTKGSLLIGAIFSVGAVLADLIGPYIIGQILDSELIEGIGPRDIRFYILLLLAYYGAVLFASLSRYLAIVFFNRTANGVARHMQEDTFRHVQFLPLQFFDRFPAGKVVSRITNDTKDVRVLFQVVLSQLTTAAIYGMGVYIGLALLDWRLALMALIPVPLALVVFFDFKTKSKKFNYAYRRYLSDLNAELNEHIQGMEIIQAYNKEEEIYEEFEQVNQKVFREGLNFTKLFAYSAYNAMGTIRQLTFAAALLYFGYGAITGAYQSTIGLLYIFINYMTTLFDFGTDVVLRVGELEKARAAADHVFELLQEEPETFGGLQPEGIKGEVAFERVSFSYNGKDEVLKDIDFATSANQSIAFVGHTGSGKSTIMNLLFGYYQPQKGCIRIDGVAFEDYDKRAVRSHMSIVLQDPFLFTGDIYSNITMFDDSIGQEAATQALLEVGGREFLAKQPDGIRTMVQEKGSTFSAGERQLISFARALVQDPKILVLDEATSNIDSETEVYIQKGIERLQRGRTTFIIAHRLSTIKNVDRIYVLDKGRIAQAGTHTQLIQQGGIYKEMYEAQS